MASGAPYGDRKPMLGSPANFGDPYQNNMPMPPGAPPPYPEPSTSPPPTAPSLGDMQTFQGYENISFEDALIAPPAAQDWRQEPPMRRDITNLPYWTEAEVREAAVQYVASNCCYGKGVVRDMSVEQIDMSNAYHYTLETFGEKRESAWVFEPYHGQPIDGPANGPAPRPWDITLYPDSNFVDSKAKVEVPHTAFVKPCHSCVGNGRVRCTACSGYGQKTCTWCHGTGRRDGSFCTWCSGGRTRCTSCDATGQVTCHTCRGKGTLKGFVQMTVTWTNHYDDFISDTSKLPKEKVRDVTGDVVFEEENPRVWPIMHSKSPTVDSASNDLVQKHANQFSTERILKQRHYLRVIPVAEATYRWKSKCDQFYVYGLENKCYFKKYPQNCCCGCSIL